MKSGLEKISLEDSSVSKSGGESVYSGEVLKALAPSQMPQHLNGNAFGSNASKVLLSIRKRSVRRAVSFRDPFGSNILHLACYNGASAESMRYIMSNYSPSINEELVQAVDMEGRTPLHLSAECICRNKIDLKEGLEVIRMLIEVQPNIIHCGDHNKETALDVVFCSIRHIHSQSSESRNLMMLYTFLRDMNMKAYMAKKQKWESEGYNMMIIPKADDRTIETTSIGDVSTLVSLAMVTVNTENELHNV